MCARTAKRVFAFRLGPHREHCAAKYYARAQRDEPLKKLGDCGLLHTLVRSKSPTVRLPDWRGTMTKSIFALVFGFAVGGGAVMFILLFKRSSHCLVRIAGDPS